MSAPLLAPASDEVSPLELFFDLAFVFAVSQLSAHLAEDLTWTGAGQTAVLLVAVFGVWAFSSFGVALAGRGRDAARSIFVVLFLSLFMNAVLPRAFTGDGAVFVVPFLVCRLGQTLVAAFAAGPAPVRRHHRAVLVWVGAESVLWVVGVLVPPEARLGWWGAAALVDVVGFRAGHPLPGPRFDSRAVALRPARIVERSRLLLLIALGETVLSVGAALAGASISIPVVVAAALALTTASLLWALYFRVADPVVDASTERSADPLRVARIAVNSQLVVLAGLIVLAVADEVAIRGPGRSAGPAEAVAMTAGPALYLAAQTWYLHALTGTWSRARVIALLVLAAAWPLVATTPALVGVLLTTAVLAVLVAVVRVRPSPAPA